MASAFEPVNAHLYRDARPTYPSAAIESFAKELGAIDKRVLDVACGTGTLTLRLSEVGARVIGVDATMAMLHANMSSSRVACGVAERLPFRTERFAAAVIGQAFHWLEPVLTLSEVARILVPKGRLGLIWNFRDLTSPAEMIIDDVLRPYAGGVPSWGGVQSWPTLVENAGPFRFVRESSLAWERRQSVDDVIAGVLTRSYVAALAKVQQSIIIDELRSRLIGWSAITRLYVATWYVFQRI